MAAPVGTAEIPVFIRFDGLEHQVGTIELDVMGEVTPQVKSAERAIAHALAPAQGERVEEDTAGDGSEDYRTAAACAWTDYRNAYGVPEHPMTAAHKAFLAGWDAARGADHAGVLR
jgi:hypothetical protein